MPRAKNNRPDARDKRVLVAKSDEWYNGPNRSFHVEVYIDWVALFRTLGRRAAENKNGTASLMYGTIVVKAKS